MRSLDFSSWQGLLSTLLGLAVITLIAVGIRLLVMQTVQQRRERENRQINERLRTLIAAYKTLGGSFTGRLSVNPIHLRDLRRAGVDVDAASAVSERLGAENERLNAETEGHGSEIERSSSDRSRRIRDAVEAALSDIILLGTEEQVRLAAAAASELAAGRAAYTDELVVSLRNFIRQVLDLDPVPPHVSIPKQGPARPSAARGGGGKGEGGGGDGGRQSGGRGAGGGGAGAGAGAGIGMGLGLGGVAADEDHGDRNP